MNKQIREYRLQMENPFERAIAFALLRFVAFHPTCVFKYFEYEKGFGKRENLKLTQSSYKLDPNDFDEPKKEILKGLEEVYTFRYICY